MNTTPKANELQVGQLAMIIGISKPENSSLVGKIVKVEELLNTGDILPNKYLNPYSVLRMQEDKISELPVVDYIAIVSGDIGVDDYLINNYGLIDPKFLMPLPPLEDPGIDECTFTPIVQQEPA